MVYFYDGEKAELMHLEIYCKGAKATEDRQRLHAFWQEKLDGPIGSAVR